MTLDAFYAVLREQSVLSNAYYHLESKRKSSKWFFSSNPPPLRKNELQMAFKQGPRILQILFGVGFGGGDALKRFVKDADDAVLFGKRGDRNLGISQLDLRNTSLCVSGGLLHQFIFS